MPIPKPKTMNLRDQLAERLTLEGFLRKHSYLPLGFAELSNESLTIDAFANYESPASTIQEPKTESTEPKITISKATSGGGQTWLTKQKW